MPLTITLVAALSVQELLLDRPIDNANAGETQQKWVSRRRSWAGVGHSLLLGDSMVLLRAVGAAEYSGATEEFCASHGIRTKALHEIRKLRVQLTNELNLILPSGPSVAVDPHMSPPTDLQANLLRQILLAGLPDHVARRIPVEEIKEQEDKRKFKHAYRCPEMEDPVFVHPNSILRHSRPEWIVYQDIYESQGKIYLRGITAIEPEWLPIFSPSQCTFSAPLERPAPRYDPARGQVLCHMNVTFGRSGWMLPLMELELLARSDKLKYFAQFFLDGSVCTPLAK
jgi:ATP-dependent RNA helicase DHX37/DHR1